ncbi:MAG: hypothetical protein FIB07_16635 [Candidatus Methanoperedens sp.]|nr:hypothetical protein [Candidatus Methanoperedens sp.]
MATGVSWAEHFYSYFLGRDICYIFVGGLLISIVEYAYFGKIYFPEGLSLEVGGFLMISYLVGLSIVAIANIIHISPKTEIPDGYSFFSFDHTILNTYNQRVLNIIERMTFMSNIGAYVGLSSLLGAAFMIILNLIRLFLKIGDTSFEYKLLVVSLVIFGIIMIYYSNTTTKEINQARKELAAEIAIIKKKSNL